MIIEEPTKKEPENAVQAKPKEDLALPKEELIPLSNLYNDMQFLFPRATIPSHFPKKPMDMIVIYKDGGGARRLYLYDIVSNTWHYTDLT